MQPSDPLPVGHSIWREGNGLWASEGVVECCVSIRRQDEAPRLQRAWSGSCVVPIQFELPSCPPCFAQTNLPRFSLAHFWRTTLYSSGSWRLCCCKPCTCRRSPRTARWSGWASVSRPQGNIGFKFWLYWGMAILAAAALLLVVTAIKSSDLDGRSTTFGSHCSEISSSLRQKHYSW